MLLPLLVIVAIAIACSRPRGWRDVRALAPVLAASFVTLVSKAAFFAYGIGIASLNFAGFSGHAQLAASIYPVTAWCAASRLQSSSRALIVLLACMFAAAIAASRVVLHAHAFSESSAGYTLGVLAALLSVRLLNRRNVAVGGRVLALAVALALILAATMPVVQTQPLIIRLALLLSGRSTPHLRSPVPGGAGH